jgi:arylsulfatase A-like enzyme
MLTLYHGLSILILLLMAAGCKVQDSSEDRPNIVFLLADDHRWDALGMEGHPLLRTPNIDALASEGTYFNNSFVTTPICFASRASILSGQYVRSHGCINFAKFFSDSAFAETYPGVLRQGGYYTGFIGKYGVGNKEENMPRNKFDFWRGFAGQGHYWMDSVHLTRQMGYQVLEFLDSIPGHKPFCLSVSFKAPHVQDKDPRQFLYDTTRYKELYAGREVPVYELMDEKYWDMFPDFFRTEENIARIRWNIRFSTQELYQEMTQGYFKLITGVDDAVGRIMEGLEERGLAENTIIIYTSDNGFYLGERGLAGKWYSHDESIRVPMIIMDPRKQDQKAQKEDGIALNIDLAPTILELAGLDIPEGMDGKSLVPLLEKTARDWRRDFFFEHSYRRAGIPESEGVVNLQNKYIKYVREDPAYEYLYDLQKDPLEVINYIEDTGYSPLLETLKSRYAEYLNELE